MQNTTFALIKLRLKSCECWNVVHTANKMSNNFNDNSDLFVDLQNFCITHYLIGFIYKKIALRDIYDHFTGAWRLFANYISMYWLSPLLSPESTHKTNQIDVHFNIFSICTNVLELCEYLWRQLNLLINKYLRFVDISLASTSDDMDAHFQLKFKNKVRYVINRRSKYIENQCRQTSLSQQFSKKNTLWTLNFP